MKIPAVAPGDWPALLARARRSPIFAGSGQELPDEELSLLLQASVTIAWWLYAFAPELLERPSLDVMVVGLPGGPALADAGRPYQLLPTLLDRPAMRVSASVVLGPGGQLAPTLVPARPAITLAHAGPSFTPAALSDGSLEAWCASRAGALPDLVMLVHPRFDERVEFWRGLRALVAAGLPLGCLARSAEEASRDAWLLGRYGYDVAPRPVDNPWAQRHTESAGQGAWGAFAWRLETSTVPAPEQPVDLEALLRAESAQRLLQYEYQVWNPLRFIGQVQQTVDPTDQDRLVGMPDHHALSLDTGVVWQVEPDGLVPTESGVRVPREVLATFPGDAVAPFERVLWAVETYEGVYRPSEAAAARTRHAARVHELESEVARALKGAPNSAEIAAFTHYYLGGDAPTGVAPRAQPFFSALRARDWHAAAALIAADPTLVDSVDEDGRTALFYAMNAKHYDFARELLELGVDPDHVDHEGFAVIHDASKRDDPWPIELLQRYGADLDLGTALGLTPAVLALRYGCWAVLGFLIAAGVNLRKSVLPGASLEEQYGGFDDLPRVLRAEIDARLGKRRVIPIAAHASMPPHAGGVAATPRS